MKRSILALLVVGIILFGVCSAQSANAQKVDANLNGTWVATIEKVKFEYKFQNGNCETSMDSLQSKGTYTTENGKITFRNTNIHGGGWNEFMQKLGINSDWGLESKWYTTNEFIIAVRPNLLKLGLTEKQANEFISGIISPNISFNYSVDNKTLILINEGEPLILSKK